VEKADHGGSVPLVRSTVGNDKSARSKYCGPTGKRSAGNKRSARGGLACSVWSGGKAERPYLSLFEAVRCSALAAAWDAGRALSLEQAVDEALLPEVKMLNS
jgi:hypothetical protein